MIMVVIMVIMVMIMVMLYDDEIQTRDASQTRELEVPVVCSGCLRPRLWEKQLEIGKMEKIREKQLKIGKMEKMREKQ